MIAIAAMLAALAAWVVVGPGDRARLPGLAPRAEHRDAVRDRQLPVLPLTAILAVAIGLTAGGWVGWILAAATIIVVPRLIARLEPAHLRRHRAALARQAPEAVDLLAATLACGATPARSIEVVGRALGPPVQADLDQVAAMLALGATADQAWGVLPASHPLQAVSGAMRRSAHSGASLQAVLTGLADDLRRRHRLEVEVAARSAGVRAVGPLAACFLPAFVLLGVVPVVASFALALFSGLS
ncbi:MAG: type II secretion system F family protein [Actinomycetales bacterium]|nr:type II secretion system F family protein [Actinomycetales bacterium]